MAGYEDQEPLPPGLPPVTFAPREPRLRRPPFMFIAIGVVLVVASWVPLVLFARARVERSENPRIMIMQDMGTQPKFREQQTNDMFADGRADRPHVVGAIARGGLEEDDHYFRGYSMTAGAGGKNQVKFLEGFPQQVKVTEQLLQRGQQRFNIYCSVCHGLDGSGKGQIEIRSEELGTPLNAKSLHEDLVRGRSDGHIFNTITNGIRNMPSYSSQIPVADRWAIVAYVRALQLSQNAPPSVVAEVSGTQPAVAAPQASR
jgi:mono/diheme cytochrome c family protein